jgi:hypothetical protein
MPPCDQNDNVFPCRRVAAQLDRRHVDAGAEQRIAALTKEARELAGQAEDIENAVYDLKAVNPHARNEEGARTPEELLDIIEAKGREIAEALAVLRRKQT